MENPFESIQARLNSIENLILDLIKESKQVETREINSNSSRDELLTIDQLSKLIHLSKATIYAKHSKGEMPGVCKVGKRLYFQKDVIVHWIKESRIKSNQELQSEAESYLTKLKNNK